MSGASEAGSLGADFGSRAEESLEARLLVASWLAGAEEVDVLWAR